MRVQSLYFTESWAAMEICTPNGAMRLTRMQNLLGLCDASLVPKWGSLCLSQRLCKVICPLLVAILLRALGSQPSSGGWPAWALCYHPLLQRRHARLTVAPAKFWAHGILEAVSQNYFFVLLKGVSGPSGTKPWHSHCAAWAGRWVGRCKCMGRAC